MSEAELFSILTSFDDDIPVFYDHAVEKYPAPFLVYRSEQDDIFYADDIAYYAQNTFEVNLVTVLKDVTLETAFESMLDSNFIAYTKSEYFDDVERVYIITYNI